MRESYSVIGRGFWVGLALASLGCADPQYAGKAAASGDDARGADASTDLRGGTTGDAAAPRPKDASTPAEKPDTDRVLPRDSGAMQNVADAGGAVATPKPDASSDMTVTMVSSEPLDAGMMTASTVLPSWAPQLLGKYAVALYGFADDGLVRSNSRGVLTMDITAGSDGYQAVTSLCESYANSQTGVGSSRVAKPTALPPRRMQIVLGTDTFVAKPIDVALGYEQTLPASCEGHLGERVPKRDFQTWISGSTCHCSDEAPPKLDDCRVVDADGDKRPGYTVTFRAGTALTDVYGASESRSSLVQGKVGANGAHTAYNQVNELVAQFGCDPAGCADVSGVPSSCDTITSRVLFASLERADAPAEGWSCASILERFSTLFPLPAPSFPARCNVK